MNTTLYNEWLERIDSYYEEKFFEPIVNDFCQYHGGTMEGRVGKGKTFNAGYEVFIYAFFLGLYSGERRPLIGKKRKFRMEMKTWGNVNQKGRRNYSKIQQYVFAALVAKTDIDFIALDKGEIVIEDVCSMLMDTLNEYANQGFYIIAEKMEKNPKFFYESKSFLSLLSSYCEQ